MLIRPKLDDKDWQIISMLQNEPKISQIEISKRLGLTQPSVSMRLRRLKESGIISFQVGMNLKKSDLFIAKIDLTVKSESNKLIEAFSRCPYCINGFILSGKHNLTLLFVSEDVKTLEAIVDNRLRPLPQVTDIEFSIALAPMKDFIVPITAKVNTNNPSEKGPCGADCLNCDMYNANRCLGCPATMAYKGDLWKMFQYR